MPAKAGIVLLVTALIDWLSRLNRNLSRQAAARRESEEHYRALFRDNALPMWLFEPGTLRIVDVNAAAIREFGYDRERLQGMTLPELCTDDERDHRTVAADPGGS